MPAEIKTIADLEACIGVPSLGIKMKVIDHIDAQASDWISASSLAFLGSQTSNGPRVTLAGGEPGFAAINDDGNIILPLDSIDHSDGLAAGQGAGVLCLAKGTGETLRANGTIASVTDTHIQIAVEECFVHCAKALIRSDFWQGGEPTSIDDTDAFLNQARFLAYVTMDKNGRIDISPKGDPAGYLLRYSNDQLLLPERPGNKLAFGFRNILEQPLVAGLAIIPGQTNVVHFVGRATLKTDEADENGFAIESKVPKLLTQISDVKSNFSPSAALQKAQPWSESSAAPDIDPAAAIVAHIKLNKQSGVQATMVRMAVNRGLVGKGLKENYKEELY